NVDIHGRGQTAVLGTPGFMAPEVVLGQAPPSNSSDLFSLAVLMFRLLTKHDPFRGEAELAFSCLNDNARRHLYGEQPVFIFDPEKRSNRPDPEAHLVALITWPLYPRLLQQTFEQTFCAGLRDPGRRVVTGQWKRVLSQVLDQRRLCPSCGEENFSGAAGAGLCWNCGQELREVQVLQGAQSCICIAAGNAIHRHHFSALQGEAIDQPWGCIVPHPSEPNVLGIQNDSNETWRLQLRNGESMALKPGQRCNAAAVVAIHCSLGSLSAG
ncbi:MAG: protein kinase, partial [Cyanobacteriota bacterium]|nr:protein kinase [Cyanobacteriota bacterium]